MSKVPAAKEKKFKNLLYFYITEVGTKWGKAMNHSSQFKEAGQKKLDAKLTGLITGQVFKNVAPL